MELVSEMLVFARVVEAKGFTSAARQLRLSTSAVSRSVGRLEAHLGVRLLQRTTRALTLTELGREVYARCAQMAETAREVQALAGSLGQAPRGRLRVSAAATLGQRWLAPLLPSFLQNWPEIDLELTLHDRHVDLVNESFDAAIRITNEPPEGMAARPLFDTAYVLVGAPAYLLRCGMPEQPPALAGHSIMYLGYDSFDDRLLLARGEARHELRMKGRATVSNSIAMLALAQAGVGLAVLPDFTAAAALREGTVQRVLPDWQLGGAYRARPVRLLYAPTRHVPGKLRAFIDHLVQAVAEEQSGPAAQG
jgi:DNA-binding transcriptional LysR family regulator